MIIQTDKKNGLTYTGEKVFFKRTVAIVKNRPTGMGSLFGVCIECFHRFCICFKFCIEGVLYEVFLL